MPESCDTNTYHYLDDLNKCAPASRICYAIWIYFELSERAFPFASRHCDIWNMYGMSWLTPAFYNVHTTPGRERGPYMLQFHLLVDIFAIHRPMLATLRVNFL